MDSKGGFYISQIKQLQDRVFSVLLSNEKLSFSGSQGRILFLLWSNDNLSLSEIGQLTSLKNNTLSSVINGMVDNGLLTRTLNPDNRRKVIISLTDYAKSLKHQYDEVSKQMTILFYQGFTQKEVTEFEMYLSRILNTLKAADHEKYSLIRGEENE